MSVCFGEFLRHRCQSIGEISRLSLAFVCAQEECSIFSDERSDMLRLIEDNKFKSFEFSYFGVEGSCQVEYAGYEDVAASMDVLWPKEGEKNRFEMKFRLEKK